jgi:hypothetical protein
MLRLLYKSAIRTVGGKNHLRSFIIRGELEFL